MMDRYISVWMKYVECAWTDGKGGKVGVRCLREGGSEDIQVQ
jgi:hypothetical protein